MQKRLAIVDALRRIEPDQHVLIEKLRVGARGLDGALIHVDVPWPDSNEGLAADQFERLLKSRIGGAAGDCHHSREESPDLFESGLIFRAHGVARGGTSFCERISNNPAGNRFKSSVTGALVSPPAQQGLQLLSRVGVFQRWPVSEGVPKCDFR